MEILIQIIVLTIFIVACAWWNYREGMMQGINNTLDTLHKAGIIDMNNIDINKAYKKTGTETYRKHQMKE